MKGQDIADAPTYQTFPLCRRAGLIGRTSRMNEVAVFVGLLFWAWVWGIVGMLLAVPMLGIVKAVCDRVDDLKLVGELLGE
jgi:predicted PurR-regulated permease PerM